ncbi:MiAMP1 family antimicrobial peptide [Nonomuraea sp. K274]|uniref:MiAMP1 family antimicrobial peptide n=1 Tax=Nonomuraea cypriaca TaxID=1187855 RepID=A0A931EWK4_9ACTN|nr:MiAMP1 family antimicrobial peptide [Nonomuraea cypriaca]MBF8184552.1 MiAMP1 family antimicrobial peptide [Nonomuraea cypriaca]
MENSHRRRPRSGTRLRATCLALLGAASIATPLIASPANAVSAPARLALSATSTFVAYSGSSFSGDSEGIQGCGLHTISYHGSYKWYANGQSGHLFNNSTGSGVPHTRLASDDNAESGSGFAWGSILIVC